MATSSGLTRQATNKQKRINLQLSLRKTLYTSSRITINNQYRKIGSFRSLIYSWYSTLRMLDYKKKKIGMLLEIYI